MQIPRIYQECELLENTEIELDQRATHHLIHVLRLSVDHPIILFNGRGGEFTAHISKIQKKQVFVKIKSFSPIERESDLKIHLAQGISKSDKMDFIIQKATELSVTSITPIITERCNIKLSADRKQKCDTHWQNIIISACEQCGRNQLPVLNDVIDFKSFIKKLFVSKNNFQKLILHPGAKKTLKELSKNCNDILILIGPEGGLTETEINLAHQHDFLAINLGPCVLRTETAAIAVIAVLQISGN